MKKISMWSLSLHEAEKRELSNLQKEWKDYFMEKLEKFGASSPAELSEEERKEFFNDLKKDWEKGEGVKEAEIKLMGLTEAKVESAEEFKKYGRTVLKKAFGDDYDEDKADKTLDGILKKVGKDYGAAVGILQQSLAG
jgi:SpoVK/Ycf46/Vps4 family AAA+-type ATPase